MPVTFSATLRKSRFSLTKLASGADGPAPSLPISCGSPSTRSTSGIPSLRARWAFSRAIKRGKSISSRACSSAV
jgi:hypothetical protein